MSENTESTSRSEQLDPKPYYGMNSGQLEYSGMRRAFLPAIVFLTACNLPGDACAVVRFEFTGSVNSVVDPNGLLDGSVAAGVPVTGHYVFDPQTPDSDPTFSDYGRYLQERDNLLSFRVGNYEFFSGYEITVVNNREFSPGEFLDAYIVQKSDSPSRFYRVVTRNEQVVVGYSVNLLALLLDDFDAVVFNSDRLPLLPPNLSEFELRDLQIVFSDGSGAPTTGIHVDIEALRAVPIPEPSSHALITAGFLVAVAIHRGSNRVKQREPRPSAGRART